MRRKLKKIIIILEDQGLVNIEKELIKIKDKFATDKIFMRYYVRELHTTISSKTKK